MKWAFAIVVVSVAFWGLPLRAQETAVVKIQIHPQTILTPVTDDFIGLGYETSAVAQMGLLSPNDQKLVQLYRNLTSHGLVRIGGIISDHTRYEPQGTATVRPYTGTTVINAAALQSLAGFLRATGWKAMWGLNLETGSKAEASDEAVAVTAALGDRLQSFEIGNEVDLGTRFFRPRSFDFRAAVGAQRAGMPFNENYERYHTSYQDYKAAVRATCPAALFSGPDIAMDTTWCAQFVRTEATDMKTLTHHYYRSGASLPDATLETLLAADPRLETLLRTLKEDCLGRPISYRINEVNSFFGGGKEHVSDTFGSALWCLDFMFLLATHECGGVNIETDVNQHAWISSYSPIFRDPWDRPIARPCYYGMLAFALAAKGEVLNLTVDKTEINLTAYSTKDKDGRLWVTIINKDLHRGAHVRIFISDSSDVGEVVRLKAPSAQSENNVTLAGAAVADDGTWTPASQEIVHLDAGCFGIDVPSSTAALLQVNVRH